MSDNINSIQKQIDAYIKGTLSEEEISDLWVQFAKNPELLDELEIEVGVRELLNSEFKAQNPGKKARAISLPNWTWTAAAAAVLLIVAMVQLFRVPSLSSMDELVVAEIPADQLETADGIRAKDIVISNADSILNLGFNAFVNGRIEQALNLYHEVIDDYDHEPYGSKAYLNIGIIQYNSGEYELAIESLNASLDRVQESRMIEEKAHWFLGNALVNMGRDEEARIAVYNAYSLDGVFRKPAFLLLQKLNHDLGFEDTESEE
jgi:tetratricopeptide (TPR) repeat protein